MFSLVTVKASWIQADAKQQKEAERAMSQIRQVLGKLKRTAVIWSRSIAKKGVPTKLLESAYVFFNPKRCI